METLLENEKQLMEMTEITKALGILDAGERIYEEITKLMR